MENAPVIELDDLLGRASDRAATADHRRRRADAAMTGWATGQLTARQALAASALVIILAVDVVTPRPDRLGERRSTPTSNGCLPNPAGG